MDEGGGTHVDVGLGFGAEDDAGAPLPLYHQFMVNSPTLSSAKKVNRPVLMSRPPHGQPGH